MIVYALNSYLTSVDGYDGIVTLYSIGEKDEVPPTYKDGNITTSYYTDISEARRAFKMTKDTHDRLGKYIKYSVEI